LRFTLSGAPAELEVEGYTPEELHSTGVEARVSGIARHPEVRAFMRDAQRSLGAGGAVMEGRDIATVVFPEAPVKLFLTAEPRVREARRAKERGEPGRVVARELQRRDERDARVNPFEPAPDAIVLDTTDASVDETLARALSICRELLP
jgi:cytidylate kinase